MFAFPSRQKHKKVDRFLVYEESLHKNDGETSPAISLSLTLAFVRSSQEFQ